MTPKEEPKQETQQERERGITITQVGKQETLEEVKDLNYWKNNAEEDYLAVPISVLRYISELEKQQERMFELVEEYNQMLVDPNVHEDHKEKSFKEWFKQFKNK
jgi:hypothetical protein